MTLWTFEFFLLQYCKWPFGNLEFAIGICIVGKKSARFEINDKGMEQNGHLVLPALFYLYSYTLLVFLFSDWFVL